MKKLIVLFAGLSLALLTGCEKKDDNPSSLAGTVWATIQPDGGAPIDGTLTFAATTFELILKEEGEIIKRNGRYTYAEPVVTLIDADDETDILRGTVDGDTMTFNDDGDITVLQRK